MPEAAAFALFLARVASAIVLVVAGLAKMRNGQDRLLRTVMGYQILPGPVASAVARVLPLVEVLTGALLMAGLFTALAAAVAFWLFLTFTLAMLHSLLFGVGNACGCFRDETPVRWRLVVRNVALMGLALSVALGGPGAGAADLAIGYPATWNLWHVSVALIPLLVAWSCAMIGGLMVRLISSQGSEKRRRELGGERS